MTSKKPAGFEALAKLRDSLPQAVQPTTPATPAATAKPSAPRKPTRAVIRLERKGRRGKEATIIEKLELTASELDEWCRELKRALGCGGSVEGEAIVLQGDLRQRVATILADRVERVTIGS